MRGVSLLPIPNFVLEGLLNGDGTDWFGISSPTHPSYAPLLLTYTAQNIQETLPA